MKVAEKHTWLSDYISSSTPEILFVSLNWSLKVSTWMFGFYLSRFRLESFMVNGGSSRDMLLKYNKKRQSIQEPVQQPSLGLKQQPMQELEDYIESVKSTIRTYKARAGPSWCSGHLYRW